MSGKEARRQLWLAHLRTAAFTTWAEPTHIAGLLSGTTIFELFLKDRELFLNVGLCNFTGFSNPVMPLGLLPAPFGGSDIGQL